MWLVDQLDQKRPLAINRWGRFKWVDLVLFSDLKKSSTLLLSELDLKSEELLNLQELKSKLIDLLEDLTALTSPW